MVLLMNAVSSTKDYFVDCMYDTVSVSNYIVVKVQELVLLALTVSSIKHALIFEICFPQLYDGTLKLVICEVS